MKDYRHRPNVRKFLHIWKTYLRENGAEKTKETLSTGQTIMIDRKDRMGLLQSLELIPGFERPKSSVKFVEE